MMDIREMRMGVRRLDVLVLVDVTDALRRSRMAVGMVGIVMPVPVFVPFRAMDMPVGMLPGEENGQ